MHCEKIGKVSEASLMAGSPEDVSDAVCAIITSIWLGSIEGLGASTLAG